MVYRVIVDISNGEVDRVFDYSAAFPVETGSRVLVPFGHRQSEGFVIGTKDSTDVETKDIIKVLDPYPAVLPEMLSLMSYMKKQNLRYIDCLRLFIPSKLRGGRVKILTKVYITLNPSYSENSYSDAGIAVNAHAQQKLFDRLKAGGAYESDLNKEFSPSALKVLTEKNIAQKEIVEVGRSPVGLIRENKCVTLTAAQDAAVKEITGGTSESYLIHGVTGSGKTEIYMTVIEKMLAEGKSAVMLVPEISLTPQMLGVFRARFGDKVSLLHSGLSDGERYDEWRRLRLGAATVALGARSAVFAPVQNVGVIIIDEEHESSYVSEGNPRYFTVDIAAFRAKYNGAKLVLGSATPSIDSYLKAVRGEYKLITLSDRINRREMPRIEIIDMKKELRAGNVSIFSKELLIALDKTLAEGNQAMLFINRRGYASFVRCRSCGYVAKCTDCDVSLTYHKEDETLKCHYCGKQFHMLTECPICHFKYLKEGKTGTEKVVSEINRIFPKARVLRMDNDTTSTKNAYLDILSAFSEGKADILIGTQMIAKGHDFKNVTLVGILDADLSLYISDYRCNERTFQLITQVAGRAGREQKAGRVIMQTYSPDHFVFRYAARYNYKGFFEREANSREASKFPPYTTILRLMVLSDEEEKGLKAAREIYLKLREYKESAAAIIRVQVMRAPVKRIENRYRFQIVLWLKNDNNEEALAGVYERAVTQEKNVTVFAEINPQQML